jgi:hypothetical protein
LNFEFLLVLNHYEDWGLPKGGGFGKEKAIILDIKFREE